MSTRSGLRTLIRLSPEITTGLITSANLDILLDKAQIDISVKGRALPRNEKVNLTANSRYVVVSGASPVLTGNDFLALDLHEGGVLFYDGSRWVGPPEFAPKTREWLDEHDVGWRTRSATTGTPQYWFLGTAEDNSSNLVVGLSETPSANKTDYLWIHYLSRGTLMADDAHYPFTGSTTQLRHLEQYDLLLCYWCWEYINRNILHSFGRADAYLELYLAGAQAMANRMPMADHLAREGMKALNPMTAMTARGGRRY